MPIVWSGLAPHPPIIVPSVGEFRCEFVAKTIESMRAWSEDLVAADIEHLVLISPHTPRPHDGLGAWLTKTMDGNFGRFGASCTNVQLPVDQTWMKAFTQNFPQITNMEFEPLDHGALVPLFFLAEAGWNGPTSVLGLPWGGQEKLPAVSEAVKAACNQTGRTALVASGDMSHCLTKTAPCGYHEAGKEFDDAFVALIREGKYDEAENLDVNLQIEARQDVVESCMIAWKACDYKTDNMKFYSYEGPFGVGYAVMKFFGESA